MELESRSPLPSLDTCEGGATRAGVRGVDPTLGLIVDAHSLIAYELHPKYAWLSGYHGIPPLGEMVRWPSVVRVSSRSDRRLRRPPGWPIPGGPE